jgi:NAD(P)-dependent dehydrogenase (short-subunit alcohol dehydrogenase family)
VTRNVIITGGTRGIGRAIASAFAAQGDQVLATGVETELPANTENLEFSRLDVRDAEAVEKLANNLLQLDVLINCAGILQRDNREHEVEGFEEVVDVNLLGTMRCCYACRDLLAKSHGCVLNMASMLTFFGSGPAPAYSASKGGVAQLTRSLAIAWADQQVRVNAIAPGWIETNLTRELTEDSDRSAAIVERTPLGRWGQVDDLTGAALFLCSAQAAFITGVILPVDGGYSVR